MTGTTRSSIAAVFVALTLVVAAAGGGAAAGTATIDEETSTTNYQSEIVSNTAVSNPTNNTSVVKTVTTKVDTNDTKTVIKPENGSYDSAVNSSTENVDHNVSGNEENWHNATFTHGDLALDTEHAPGENVTMLAVAYNNTSMSDSDQATGNVTFYLDYNNDTTTEVIDDDEVDDSDLVAVTDEDGLLNLTTTDNSEIEAEDMEVPNETLYLASANGTVSDDIDAVVDDFDSESVASNVFSVSLWGPNAFVSVSDGDTTTYVPVYVEEAPDDAPDTYAVVTDDIGGSSGLAIHGLDEEFDSGDDVDVTAAFGTGTDGFFTGYVTQSVTSFTGFIFGGVGGTFALLAPLSLRRRDEDSTLAGDEL